jgi:uncharacterized membrane protein
MNKIERDLDELVAKGLLGEDAAQNIRNYYANKRGVSNSSLVGIFTAIGSLLVGLGIILLVAHNWDALAFGVKIFFAFLPLALAQLFCFFTLWKRGGNKVLRESSGTLLVLSIASAISLISQIYQIDGDIGDFLSLWILLSIVGVYLMQSSISWIILLIASIGYLQASGQYEEYISAAFVLSLLPYYVWLYRTNPEANALRFFNWLYPIALIISSMSLSEDGEEYGLLVLLSISSFYYVFGKKYIFEIHQRLNGYMVIGAMGIILSLIILSFEKNWRRLIEQGFNSDIRMPMLLIGLFSILSVVVFYKLNKNNQKLDSDFNVFEWAFLLAPFFIFLTYTSDTFAVAIDNVIVFAIGILNIRRGMKQEHLGILNLGFSILGLFVIIRFFDDSWSFLLRGALFVLVGVGMFVANYVMIRKRKAMEVNNEK